MANKELIYRWDEPSGRMRLYSGSLRLSKPDQSSLESELRRRYEALLKQLDGGESEAIVAFHATATVSRRVTGFRVRYSRVRRTRCPELVLLPILERNAEADRAKARHRSAPPPSHRSKETAARARSPAETAEASTGLAVSRIAPWVVGFLEDVRGRLSDRSRTQLTHDDRYAISFILANLQTLCCGAPEDLAVFLLAGFVSLGERISEYSAPDEARQYRSAARVLEQLCGWQIFREASGAGSGNEPPPEEALNRLRRIMRFFGNALGFREEEDLA